MDKANAARIQELCALIAKETNRERFLRLVEELNQILATKDDQLRENKPDDPKPRQ